MKYKCLCGAEHEISIPDAAVVERFNELVREGKIELCGRPIELHYEYRLRPTPRYRPFTAVEAAGHIGKPVQYRNRPNESWSNWSIAGDEAWGYSVRVGDTVHSPDDAHNKLIFTDTGEPFGQKVSE